MGEQVKPTPLDDWEVTPDHIRLSFTMPASGAAYVTPYGVTEVHRLRGFVRHLLSVVSAVLVGTVVGLALGIAGWGFMVEQFAEHHW